MRMKSIHLQNICNTQKSILQHIKQKKTTNLNFIPYGIHAVSKVGTMRNIILQRNFF